MASIRRLKKDIDYLTFAVIADSLNCLSYGKNTDDISGVVENVVEMRNTLRQRVNAGKCLKAAEKKAHYKEVRKEVMVCGRRVYQIERAGEESIISRIGRSR